LLRKEKTKNLKKRGGFSLAEQPPTRKRNARRNKFVHESSKREVEKLYTPSAEKKKFCLLKVDIGAGGVAFNRPAAEER